jgi:hypothetical protein
MSVASLAESFVQPVLLHDLFPVCSWSVQGTPNVATRSSVTHRDHHPLKRLHARRGFIRRNPSGSWYERNGDPQSVAWTVGASGEADARNNQPNKTKGVTS